MVWLFCVPVRKHICHWHWTIEPLPRAFTLLTFMPLLWPFNWTPGFFSLSGSLTHTHTSQLHFTSRSIWMEMNLSCESFQFNSFAQTMAAPWLLLFLSTLFSWDYVQYKYTATAAHKVNGAQRIVTTIGVSALTTMGAQIKTFPIGQSGE